MTKLVTLLAVLHDPALRIRAQVGEDAEGEDFAEHAHGIGRAAGEDGADHRLLGHVAIAEASEGGRHRDAVPGEDGGHSPAPGHQDQERQQRVAPGQGAVEIEGGDCPRP